MSGAKAAKKKLSFWETLRAASGTYGRLYGYLKPYKVRFILGLALGLAYGGVTSLLPWATARVASTIFPRCRSKSDGHALKSSCPRYRPKNQFDRADLPCHSGDHDFAQPLFLRQHLLHAMGEQQGRH